MSSRYLRTFLAVAAGLVIAAPLAAADRATDPECAALENSVLPAPDWYAARCLNGAAVTDYSQYTVKDGFVPGDLAYYKSNFPTNDFKRAPLATLTFTAIGPQARPLFAMQFDSAAAILYAVDNTSHELGTLNQTTGVFTSIAVVPVPAGLTVTGMAFDPTVLPPSNAYFTATNGTTASLWKINIATGALTNQVTIAGFPFTIDIAIDRTGQMYGHDINADVLIRIDKATGATTVVGPTGIAANFAQGMMYDNSDDTLYGCAFVISPAQQGELVRFNKTTGAATVVAGPVPDELECGAKVPAILAMVPMALAVDTAGNGVLQPNEAAVSVQPSWRNPNTAAVGPVTGTLSNFTGPTGPTYTIVDGAAAYGTVAAGATVQCTDCYAVTAAAPTRPSLHWDATADEVLSAPGGTKTWRLHVGDSFADVPATNIFYRFIETILHRDVTGGCTATNYCPGANTTREQMAVFVLISKEGSGYNPPACVAPNLFSDVPDTSPFCKFIEEIANRGVVTGCGPNLYCPTANATREQMAVFVLRTLDPTLNPPACVAGSEAFNDVPASSPFCKFVEELARRGIVTGCGGGAYCPTAPVTREQMSVFLSGTFSLTLYGVN